MARKKKRSAVKKSGEESTPKPTPPTEPARLPRGGTLSPQRFADAKGVSRQAVMKAIDSGRLKDSVTRTDGGRWRIDPEIAAREWAENTDPTHQIGARAVEKGKPKPKAEVAKTAPLFGTEEEKQELGKARTSQASAAAQRTLIDAELKKLELETRRGNLIDREVAQRETFRIAREVRDAIMGIADRVSAEFASSTNPNEIHRRLTEEHVGALRSIEIGEEFDE